LVIFIADEIPGLNDHIAKGTSRFAAITPSSFGGQDNAELSRRGKKYMEKLEDGETDNPEFDRVAFENSKLQKLKQKYHTAISSLPDVLIIAKTALLNEDYAEVERDMSPKGTYADTYNSLYIKASLVATAAGKKTLYFISGKEFTMFANLLTKGDPEKSITISNPKIREMMDTEFIPAVLNADLNLIVVNTSSFSEEDKYFYSRAGEVGGYTSHPIELPPDPAIGASTPQPTSNGKVTNTNFPGVKIKASELKKKLKKIKWLITSWETFMKDLKEEALEAKYLQPDQEIEDDLTPKDEVLV
jgi:hypothetical protein